jgi:hypothetical protein
MEMDAYRVVLSPSSRWTRVLVTHGSDELLRAVMPAPSSVRHERAAATFIEGLALWLDTTLPVVLCVAAEDRGFCLGEMGLGHRSVFYRVEVQERGARRRRGSRIRGVADFSDIRQICMEGIERSRP